MSFKLKLGLILWLAGLTGILSLLMIDFDVLASIVSHTLGSEVPKFTLPLKILVLVQPAVLLLIAVTVGVFLAPKVGLRAPVAEALARSEPFGSDLKKQIVPGLIGGLMGGLLITLTALTWRPYLGHDLVSRIAKFASLLPVVTRLLYGGITEEVLIRWGLMTLFVWLLWRVLRGELRSGYFVAATLLSSLIFGLGHLPAAFLVESGLTIALTSFIIVANSWFGLIAGYLYWRYGLESAMIAHLLTHVLLYTANRVGLYF